MKTWMTLCQRGELGAASHLEDRTLLFERGEPADRVFFLSSGVVELLQRSKSGSSLVVKLLVAPTLFGTIEALAEQPDYLETVRAAMRVTVHSVSVARFHDLLRRDHAATLDCLQHDARAFCVAARFQGASMAPPEALLANLMLAYLDVFGDANGTISIRRTQSDFADGIGATERSVNRILSRWKDEALISKKRGRYSVLKPDVLQVMAAEIHDSLVLRCRPTVQQPLRRDELSRLSPRRHG